MPFSPFRVLLEPFSRMTRKFLRRRMVPMSQDEALEKKEFFAKLYFLSSFGLFCGLTIYAIIHFEDFNKDFSEEIIKTSSAKKVYKFEGMKLKESYVKENPEEKSDTLE